MVSCDASRVGESSEVSDGSSDDAEVAAGIEGSG